MYENKIQMVCIYIPCFRPNLLIGTPKASACPVYHSLIYNRDSVPAPLLQSKASYMGYHKLNQF